MSYDPFSGPPYIYKRLDRWKVVLAAVLFVLVVAGALFWPV